MTERASFYLKEQDEFLIYFLIPTANETAK
ncbi:hypothetical protein BB14905_12065 [Bacillus sp. B14905]|nr:hypothetical protein BB14905_12065 [Bacillus sp. B14905]